MNHTTVVRDFADTTPARARASRVPAVTYEPQIRVHHPALPRSELPPVPFRECRISFAIDISQSTRGPILAEECAFIRNFSEGLSPESKELVRVLPWDEISHKIIKVEELENIDPGGRTDPNVLVRNKEQIDVLQASHLWFLLTDGEIVPNTVRRFAFSINSRSLHGTACVIVILGKRPAKPILCNVSVGISVFAVTPNCLFIFHDVDTHTPYILQCKGCFSALLPKGLKQVELRGTTEWWGIPKCDYLDLFSIKVPPPTKLDINQIQLQSGRKIDLEDLYQGRVDKAIQDEILQNDDNLKSVILVATTRGQNRDIHNWIAARRDTFADLVNMPRPDIDGKATLLVKEILEALQRKENNSFDHQKAAMLHTAHQENWDAFKHSIEPQERNAIQRGTVIDDSLARLDLIERLGPASSECMSPVSPGGYDLGAAKTQVNEKGPSSKLLFPKGYLLEVFGSGKRPVFRCRLCKSNPSQFAIMLESPPDGMPTPGFPSPKSRADVAFPFALGNFRETDIVSRTLCCPPCSVLAVEHGYSPDGKPLLGALVFGDRVSAASNINRQTWISNLETALDERFGQECLLQVLLAILYAKKDQAFSTDPILAGALDIACNTLQADLKIPYESGNHHWTGAVSDVVQHYLSIGIASPGCDFLNHPVDSFVLMIRMASTIEMSSRAGALFYRLILHIIEHKYVIQDTLFGDIVESSFSFLKSELFEKGVTMSEAPVLETLCDNHLMNRHTLEIFRAAHEPFAKIEAECGAAICLFIGLFYDIGERTQDPRQLLHWFCTMPELSTFFATPWNFHDSECRMIWENLT